MAYDLEQIAPAFNPMIIEVPADLGTIVTVVVGIEGSDPVTLIRESVTTESGSFATFDISLIVKRAFVHNEQPFFGSADFFSDTRFIVRYGVNVFPGNRPGYKIIGYAINAVRQLGGNVSTSDLSKFPYMYPRIDSGILYKGYPVDIVVRNFQPGVSIEAQGYRDGAGDFYTVVPTNESLILKLHRGTESAEIEVGIFDESTGAQIEYIYALISDCLPENPFFVRWVNRFAAYDYAMFGARSFDDVNTSDRLNVQRYISGSSNELHSQQAINLTARRVVTVGKNGLNKDEFDRLRGIALSPVIEHYNEALKAWETIIIEDDTSAVWDGRSGLGSIEIEFTLPRILTQF